uniref:Uncharacterized protein n=1 Tax=uncultured Armatimonadetes bacterium TaxID=157466 RepID=A0A6J4JNB8_9BACT|nr:hypothetical protein AVDCRST_MAG63-4078 [uncultured Armatimonadetes bacterium]
MSCKLTTKKLLYRSWEVVTSEGWFQVEYDGRTCGYESVLVQGEVAVSTPSLLWFVPRFEFRVGSLPASLDVRVWPWLALRSARLTIDGRVAYSEGSSVARRSRTKRGAI